MISWHPALAAVSLVLLTPSALRAQQWLAPPAAGDTAATDSAAAATTSRRAPGELVRGLPVDSAEGALLLEPGITAGDAGLSLRGAAPGGH